LADAREFMRIPVRPAAFLSLERFAEQALAKPMVLVRVE